MMLVEHMLDTARGRLATLTCQSTVCDAAAIVIDPKTPLAVVCDGEGVAIGVISRTDVLKVLSGERVDPFILGVEAIMSRSVFSCRMHQILQQVWETMSARSLRCVPILDDAGRPLGILHARDLACALLEEVTNEEVLLRDYVLGIGYQ